MKKVLSVILCLYMSVSMILLTSCAASHVKVLNSGIPISNTNTDKPLTSEYSELSMNDYEWEVLRYVNIERTKKGLTSLSMPQALQQSCDVREKEILNLFSHDRPDGTYSPYLSIDDIPSYTLLP